MKKLFSLLVVFSFTALLLNASWNPTKTGMKMPMNRLMLDADGNLTSLNDILAEGKPIFVGSQTTDCPRCDEPNTDYSNWVMNNSVDRAKFSSIYIVHDFHQQAKMGWSNAAHNGTDKGYVNDWKNLYPGLQFSTGFCINNVDHYYFPNEQGSTPHYFVVNTDGTLAVFGGSWFGAKDYILSLYTAGALTALSAQCATPAVTVTNDNTANITITVANNESGAVIRYTTDGTPPTGTSPEYTGAFIVKQSCIVRVQAFKNNMYPSKVILKAVTASSPNFVNIASSGTAYSWNNPYLTANHSDDNKVARPGLNDGNTATDVRLVTTSRVSYPDFYKKDQNMTYDDYFLNATWQGGGIVWNETENNITHIEYYGGSRTNDWWGGHGRWYRDIKLEITLDGTTWQDVTKYGYFNEFPFAQFYSINGENNYYPPGQFKTGFEPVVFYLDEPTSIRGFRLIGCFNMFTGYDWNTGKEAFGCNYINVREFKAFQNNSLSLTGDALAVEEDKNSLLIGYHGTDNATSVTQALITLATTGSNGSSITWVSSIPSVISNDGQTVNRPSDTDTTVTMTATISMGAITDTKTFTLTVKANNVPTASGQADVNYREISTYPNPVQQYLHITFGYLVNKATISMCDTQGRIVMTRLVSNSESDIVDVSSLNGGVYQVMVVTENKVYKSRFLKK